MWGERKRDAQEGRRGAVGDASRARVGWKAAHRSRPAVQARLPNTRGMLKAGTGFSRAADARQAGAEAAAQALAGLSGADAALVFAGPGYGDELPRLLDAAAAELGTAALVGASAHGVVSGGRESEDERAVAVLACQGLEAHGFLLADPAGEEEAVADEIAARLGGGPRAEDLLVLLPDPGNFDSTAFLPALAERLGPAAIVGAGAGDPSGSAPLQWCGRSLATGAVAGLLLRASKPPRIGVTQACRPLTGLMTVTRARGHWVLELDGRPALEVFREAAGGALAQDMRRAAAFVLVAQPSPGSEALVPGGYLVRHAIGLEEYTNAFAIPSEVRAGDRLGFAFRDAEAAREDLKQMLERVDGGGALGLYLNCCARGAAFFGVPGLEAAYLEQALGPTPVAGMFGACEIGPVGGVTELLTNTGVLAVLDA